MSFLTRVRSLYKNLKDSLHWARLACKIVAKCKAEIDASNADDGVKLLVQQLVNQANNVCEAIENTINNLPGNN